MIVTRFNNMELKIIIATILLITYKYGTVEALQFPDDFQFGVATASYQVEGAWNTNGKGENIWDRLTHENPELIKDRGNGDIACDTYHKTKEDVLRLKSLGVHFYRFSLSWSRILPSGFVNEINSDGVRYYNELINELIANDIVPFVTLYHWDLPQPLQEIGGWPNRELAEIFEDFARVCYENFGDRVKHWLTFNEPIQVCDQGYGIASMAPAYNSDGIATYLCSHTLLLAHARAYHLYDNEFRATQGGRVGITIDTWWAEPQSNSAEDIEAAEKKIQFDYGWYTHPIFSEEGDYPKIMRDTIDARSIEEGFSKSRLPYFTAEEVKFVQGSSDFLGLNHYTTKLVYPAPAGSNGKRPSRSGDIGTWSNVDPQWEESAANWLYVVPWGLRKLLVWIKNEFNNPEVIITESGFADEEGLNDCRRINYYNSYLEEILKAIHEDGCKVTGYTAWSFLDNFEWMMGYTQRFGIYHVDFNSPNRTRTAKMSAEVFKNIIATKAVDWDYTPTGFDPCIW